MTERPVLRRSDRKRPDVGIVHLGPGAFFRAFNATFSSDALRACGGSWGIRAVSLRSADIRDRLAPQGFAYTAVTLASDGLQHEVIEVIEDILVAPENPEAVLAAMAAANVKIVSMTITEKGYCHSPSTGDLQLDHPDIQHDLHNPDVPRSALGYLVHSLSRRKAAGLDPFTILSCDNLPENGRLTKKVVLAFARALDDELANWIDRNGRFPATMVDRITPATTDADIEKLSELSGYRDRGCVMHEPFRQWVIEDDFVKGERPQWDAAGAQYVTNVAAFETMKLRCLNGTHSALAYLGYLAGHETIAETVADPVFLNFIEQLWEREINPTVAEPEGENLSRYCHALKHRYLNPAIRHRTWQIAMDGSQKLPQRLLATVSDNLDAGRPITGLALAVAGWMRYVGGHDELGSSIDVRDPIADELKAICDSEHTSVGKAIALLEVRDVFEASLAGNPIFRSAVVAAYEALVADGARKTVHNLI